MASKPIVDVALGPHNGTLKLFSVEELHKFVQEEENFWSWLSSSPVDSQIKRPWHAISNQIASIRNQTPPIGNTLGENNRALIEDTIIHAYQHSRIPLSTSPVGKFICELREEDPIVAAAALASWMNTGNLSIGNYAHTKGIILMAAFDAGITSKTPLAVKRSLEGLQKQLQIAKAKTEKETADQRDAFSQEKLHQRKAVARLIRQSRSRLSRFRHGKSGQVAESIASIKATENLYREHMRLKGPVGYWSDKAGTHRTQAESYRKALLWFSSIAGTILLVALYCIAEHAISIATTDKPSTIYLVLVTLGVVLTTIVFWAARIITRLFLSEHHLAIDADERATMAQTYLALTAEQAATDQERAIVLGSLFRPTADGIVKDDAAPDLSPAALLSRLGSK